MRAHAGCAKRDHGDGDERAAKSKDGRQQIERPVDGRGNQILFEERLGAIDERLQEAEGADAAGSPAVLDAAHQLALEEHGVCDAHQHHHRHHGDFCQAPEKECEDGHVRLAFAGGSLLRGFHLCYPTHFAKSTKWMGQPVLRQSAAVSASSLAWCCVSCLSAVL